LPYLEAAAIYSVNDPALFQRLKSRLKDRGVKPDSLRDWERRTREFEHEIKREQQNEKREAEKERKAKEKAAQRKQEQEQRAEERNKPPAWKPIKTNQQREVNGKDLLAKLIAAIRKFVRLEPDQALIVALWILFTWIFDVAAETNPFLRIL